MKSSSLFWFHDTHICSLFHLFISLFIPLMVIFLFSCHTYVYKIYKYALHRKEYGRHLSFWVWLLSLNLHGSSLPCAWCSSKHGLLWDTDLEAFRCYIPRCGLPGPPGRSPFRLLRKIHADFQISCSLYSQQEGWFLSPSSSPMLVIFFSMMDIWSGEAEISKHFQSVSPWGLKISHTFLKLSLAICIFFFENCTSH